MSETNIPSDDFHDLLLDLISLARDYDTSTQSKMQEIEELYTQQSSIIAALREDQEISKSFREYTLLRISEQEKEIDALKAVNNVIDISADEYCEQNKSNMEGIYNYSLMSVRSAFIVGKKIANKYFIDAADAYKNAYENRQTEIIECQKRISALEKENNDLKMDNMTHEYNQAEAEKYFPEYKRQIEEPLLEEITALMEENMELKKQLQTWEQGSDFENR